MQIEAQIKFVPELHPLAFLHYIYIVLLSVVYVIA